MSASLVRILYLERQIYPSHILSIWTVHACIGRLTLRPNTICTSDANIIFIVYAQCSSHSTVAALLLFTLKFQQFHSKNSNLVLICCPLVLHMVRHIGVLKLTFTYKNRPGIQGWVKLVNIIRNGINLFYQPWWISAKYFPLDEDYIFNVIRYSTA